MLLWRLRVRLVIMQRELEWRPPVHDVVGRGQHAAAAPQPLEEVGGRLALVEGGVEGEARTKGSDTTTDTCVGAIMSRGVADSELR